MYPKVLKGRKVPKEYLGNVSKRPERSKSAERVLRKCTKKSLKEEKVPKVPRGKVPKKPKRKKNAESAKRKCI